MKPPTLPFSSWSKKRKQGVAPPLPGLWAAIISLMGIVTMFLIKRFKGCCAKSRQMASATVDI
jgi:hypothetical protein